MKKLLPVVLVLCLLLCSCSAGASQSESTPASSVSTENSSSENIPTDSDHSSIAALTCEFTPPEGFFASEEDENLYYSPDYPDDIANVVVAVGDADPYFDSYTEDLMRNALQDALSKQLENYSGQVQVDSFAYCQIDGLPAYRLQISYSYDQIDLQQTVICINANKCYAFTYTQAVATDWDDVFEDSINSIRLQFE